MTHFHLQAIIKQSWSSADDLDEHALIVSARSTTINNDRGYSRRWKIAVYPGLTVTLPDATRSLLTPTRYHFDYHRVPEGYPTAEGRVQERSPAESFANDKLMSAWLDRAIEHINFHLIPLLRTMDDPMSGAC